MMMMMTVKVERKRTQINKRIVKNLVDSWSEMVIIYCRPVCFSQLHLDNIIMMSKEDEKKRERETKKRLARVSWILNSARG